MDFGVLVHAQLTLLLLWQGNTQGRQELASLPAYKERKWKQSLRVCVQWYKHPTISLLRKFSLFLIITCNYQRGQGAPYTLSVAWRFLGNPSVHSKLV